MKTALDELKEALVTEWDEADEKTKAKMWNEYNSIPSLREDRAARREGLNNFYYNHSKAEQELMHKCSDDIHADNIKAAEKIIDNLVQRVEKKIGNITDYAGVSVSRDNEGFAILNGYFKGDEGTCEVQSIRAGGWNIQKKHIRVLVK